MPIWFELLILTLVTYVIGLGIGWVLWGRGAETEGAETEDAEIDGAEIESAETEREANP